MGYDIRKIHHLPGAANYVGDALSREYTNIECTAADRSEWTVECDWFVNSRLIFNLYTVTAMSDVPCLKEQFADVPVFLQAINALEVIQKGGDEKGVYWAKHKAREYMIEGGRLWHVSNGKSRRV